MQTFSYLLTQRPPSIGTFPVEGFLRSGIDIPSDNAQEVIMNGRYAYRLLYNRELSQEEITRFELCPDFKKEDIGKTWQRPFGRGTDTLTIAEVDVESFEVVLRNIYNTDKGIRVISDVYSFRGAHKEIMQYNK